jgi:hypothetical protein
MSPPRSSSWALHTLLLVALLFLALGAVLALFLPNLVRNRITEASQKYKKRVTVASPFLGQYRCVGWD